jgi:glycolate oxidase iron-sulfur subunit
LRALLAWLLPHPGRFRLALVGAVLARPFKALLPHGLRHLVVMAPARLAGPSPVDRPAVHAAQVTRTKRVALLAGCAQQVLTPQVNEATIRLLTRLGCEVVVAPGAGCCGALVHHMGREADAMAAARANIAAWERAGPFDAVIANASGCGTQLKEYGFLLRNDPEWAARAADLSARARDVSEVVAELDIRETRLSGLPTVAYHSACSLQHGQRITDLPRDLLTRAGFDVCDIPEGHICCGSAGTYNLLQPDLSARLRQRKVANIRATGAETVAAGNVGCMVQIAAELDKPVLHPVELLDWATGGPRPKALSRPP